MEIFNVTADAVLPPGMLNAPGWGLYIVKPKGNGDLDADGNPKLDKIPADRQGNPASKDTMCMSYGEAMDVFNPDIHHGLGYLPRKELGTGAIDQDDCVIDGQLTEAGKRLLMLSNGPAFLSLSGTGIRILFEMEPGVEYRFIGDSGATDKTGIYAGDARFVTVAQGEMGMMQQIRGGEVQPEPLVIEWITEMAGQAPAGGTTQKDFGEWCKQNYDQILAPLPNSVTAQVDHFVANSLNLTNSTALDRSDALMTAMHAMVAFSWGSPLICAQVAWHCAGGAARETFMKRNGFDYQCREIGRKVGAAMDEAGMAYTGPTEPFVVMPEADAIRAAKAAMGDFGEARHQEQRSEAAADRVEGERLYSGDEIFELPTPKYLIDKILPDSGVVMVFGSSGSGKTFGLFDLTLPIAAGHDSWHGLYDIMEQRPVVYIAGEGASGLAGRYQAWCDKYNHGEGVPDFFFKTTRLNLQSDKDVDDLLALIERYLLADRQPLIELDTISSMSPGMKENDAEFVSVAIGRIQSLGERYNAPIIFSHHTGKTDDGTARGSEVFSANVAAVLEIWREDNTAAERRRGNTAYVRPETSQLTVRKMKDDELIPTVFFNWLRVDVRGGRQSLVLLAGDAPTLDPVSVFVMKMGNHKRRRMVWDLVCAGPLTKGRHEVAPDVLLEQFTTTAAPSDARPHKVQPILDKILADGFANGVFITNPETGGITDLLLPHEGEDGADLL